MIESPWKWQVTIPFDEDSFPLTLRSMGSFTATVESVIPACNGVVVRPQGEGKSIVVPVAWLSTLKQPRSGMYRIGEDVSTEAGKVLTGTRVKAIVLEELLDGQMLLQLCDFDKTDWYSGYVVYHPNDGDQWVEDVGYKKRRLNLQARKSPGANQTEAVDASKAQDLADRELLVLKQNLMAMVSREVDATRHVLPQFLRKDVDEY